MFNKWHLAWRALMQLGAPSLASLSWYKFCVYSGVLERQTSGSKETPVCKLRVDLFPLPARADLLAALSKAQHQKLLDEAEEIVKGSWLVFEGAFPAQLFAASGEKHWSAYERWGTKALCAKLPGEDIKFLWEAARFGWAFPLARAYRLTQDERYAETFWKNTESFLSLNPPYRGIHWLSAQEVALRLMTLVFCWQVFHASASTSPARAELLARSLAEHAQRIPPSLAYARAQNNNHLLSETAGLYTAALALPDHPLAERWQQTGWQEFNAAIQTQITPAGEYIQHSANYQRLMLQEGLWMALLAGTAGESLPALTSQRLAAATAWLQALQDPPSGSLPNWGPNDGAYVFPLTSRPYRDYRPLLATAGRVFLNAPSAQDDKRNEMELWLGGKPPAPAPQPAKEGPLTMRHPRQPAWVFLRCGQFSARPGHADQNHLDLWWQGINVAQDPGTYLYNAPPPWDNSLACAYVHNTVTVNGADQMARAGRFLYLDWAQGRGSKTDRSLDAEHDGYRRFGVCHHRRVVPLCQNGWEVQDELRPTRAGRANLPIRPRLHWLLPDWRWEIHTDRKELLFLAESPYGWVSLIVRGCGLSAYRAVIQRAGEVLHGNPTQIPQPAIMGWASSNYGKKEPALSFSVEGEGNLPCGFTTLWLFPEEGDILPEATADGENSGPDFAR